MKTTETEYGKLLVFDDNINAEEIWHNIHDNDLNGLRVEIDPITNMPKSALEVFKKTTFLKSLSWYVVYYDFDVDFSFLYNYTKLEQLHIQTLSNEIDFKLIPSKIVELDIPFDLKKIKNIQSLKYLQKIGLTEFSEKDFSSLSNLSNLENIGISCSKTKSLKGIGDLLKLKSIGLHGVGCENLDELDSLTECQTLTISSFKKLKDISNISALSNLKYLDISGCSNLEDFSSIGQLKKLEVLRLTNCKNLKSIKFIEKLPNLHQLSVLGSTVINDFDTTPARNLKVFYGSLDERYNKQYPEKEIQAEVRGIGKYL